MRKLLFLAPMVALSLGGCGAGEIASTGAAAAGLFLGGKAVQQVAVAAPINTKLLAAAEKRGRDLGNSLRMAAKRSVIAASNDPDTGRPNFCEMVIKDVAVVSDTGGVASALTCRIDHHLDRAGGAAENGDSAAFTDNLAKAETYMDQLADIIRIADEGASQ